MSAAAESHLTANKMVSVDGKPRFLLGLYENPKDDAALKQAVDAGFNLIQSAANKAALDRIHAHGGKAWVNLGGGLDLGSGSKEAEDRLVKKVNSLKDHPALLVWEGPDEALWNTWYMRGTHYYFVTEFPAISKAIKEAGDPGSDKVKELEKLVGAARADFDRSLWKAFDAKRAKFWKTVGKRSPRPNATMADRAQDARRVGEGLAKGIRAVRKADPKHIVWLNHAPRNSIASMRFFNRPADMAGCDIYPVPSKRDQGHSDLRTGWLSSVGAYTDRMRAAAPGKACAMVLQGFGWRDINESCRKHPEETGIGRRPKFAESQFMALDSIVHGANAIMYWGTAYIEKDSRLWKDLLRVAGRLNALESALVAQTVSPAPVAVSDENFGSTDGDGIVVMLKKVGADYVLIAVNETPHGLPFTVKNLPADLDGKTLHRLWTDETVAVTGRAMRDGIRGTNVHVYATSRRFEPNAK